MDVRRVLLLARRWWPIVVAGTLLAAVAAYGVSKAQPRVYEASAVLRVYPGLGTPGGGGDFNEWQAAWYQASDDARLIDTMSVAQAALARAAPYLRQRIDADTLLRGIKAPPPSLSLLIDVAVRAVNADDAALLANAVADAFVAYNASNLTAKYTAALTGIENKRQFYVRDLAAANYESQRLALAPGGLTPAQQVQSEALLQRSSADQGILSQLQASADGIRLWLAGAGSSLSVTQRAIAPIAAISPRTTTNVLLAAVLAALVLTGIVLLIDAMDTRPRTAGALAAALDLPLLGVIAPSPSRTALIAEPVSTRADQYRLVRAGLGLPQNAEQTRGGAPAVAVVDLEPDAGALDVAANLAATAARAGAQVLLIDANLRRPTLHMLLSLPERGGLADVLRDGADLEPLLRDGGVLGLHVLTAGHDPAGAIDLLGSTRMRDLLGMVQANHDLVVIDAGDAASADAHVLAPLAGATVLAARLRGADRGILGAAVRGLRQAGAHLAGMVVMTTVPAAAPGRGAPRADTLGTADVERAGNPDPRTAR